MSKLEVFYPSSKKIRDLKNLIKEQGEIVCQDEISINVIKNETSEFDFGYISYGVKAKAGMKSSSRFSDSYILDGFIICSLIDDDEAVINLVCSRKTSKIGKELVEAAEYYLREIGITRVILYSLPNTKLKHWYETLNYKHITDIIFSNEQTKVHVMKKKL